MSAALENPTRETAAQRPNGLVPFILIGGGAALAFIVVSSIAIALLPRVDAWLVSAVCYGACVPPVYLLHRRFSFPSEARHRRVLPRYLATQALATALASGLGFVFHNMMDVPSLLAGVLIVVLTSGGSYLALKFWVFALDGLSLLDQ